MPALVAMLGLSDFDKRGLDFVEGLFRNHRRVYALVHLPFVEKDPVIKWVVEKVCNRGKRQGLVASIAHTALNAAEHFVEYRASRFFALRDSL